MNIATTMQAAEELKPDLLTETIVSKLANPVTNSDFDFHGTVNDVLKDVGLSTADSGGKITFYGRDPIIPSPHRFGTMAAVGLAAKAVAVAALWRHRTDEGQDIAVDVRKSAEALRWLLRPEMGDHQRTTPDTPRRSPQPVLRAAAFPRNEGRSARCSTEPLSQAGRTHVRSAQMCTQRRSREQCHTPMAGRRSRARRG